MPGDNPNRFPVPVRRRGTLRGLAREGRRKYSENQLHAGLAISPRVPARGARPVPAPIESETISRGLTDRGYYIWRVGR